MSCAYNVDQHTYYEISFVGEHVESLSGNCKPDDARLELCATPSAQMIFQRPFVDVFRGDFSGLNPLSEISSKC